MAMEQPLTDLASKRGGGLLLRSVLVVSLIVVATLFAAELLLRVIDVSGPIRSELGEAFQFDPEIGWVGAPNAAAQQTSGNRTISVQHNGLGLRERGLGDIAPDRFLFLGDSFTYGYDAEAGERFSDLLQKALPQYGMVNAGVSGYGTDTGSITSRISCVRGKANGRFAVIPCRDRPAMTSRAVHGSNILRSPASPSIPTGLYEIARSSYRTGPKT